MSSLSSLSPSVMYLITKMLIFLVLAGLIGLLIGWAIGKLGHQRRSRNIENDWRNTLADTEEDHARVVGRFKKSNQALDDENNNLRTKIAALNTKIDANREDVERARLQQRELNTQLESGQSEVQDFQRQLNEERAKNHKLQNLTKALKSSSDEKDRRLQQLTAELHHNKEQLQTLGSVENNDGYVALQREVGELRSANKENAELRQRIATEAREREDALSELYRLRQQNETLEREREDYRQWSLRLEQDQAGFDDRVQSAVADALRNEGSGANDLELEVARLRPMVNSLNAEVERLHEENRHLQITQQDHHRSSATPGSSSGQIQELQTALNEVGFERDQLRTRLADQERQTASLNAQLSGNHYPSDISDLRRQLAQVSAEKGILAATIDEMQQRLR